MQSVMRGLSGAVLVVCAVGRWLSVEADGMSYPPPSRLIQSAYHSLVGAGTFHVQSRIVTRFFGRPETILDSIDIGLRPIRERDDSLVTGTTEIGKRVVHSRTRRITLVARGIEVDQQANGKVLQCTQSWGLNFLPTWVYHIAILYPRTVQRFYAVTVGPESIRGIPVWHVRQGLRETRPSGHTSVHSVNYDVDLYVSRVTGRLVREVWRMPGHVERMSAVADYSAYGKRVVLKLPPRATRPGECRDSPPADRGAAEEGRAARIQGQL